ncbi:MAG: rhodanese-like domain-containing protein [Lewinellaceae bacterium]|nr:rhodanese-like domain-containing protein [Lewinellaceae bacterium]
MMQYFKHIVAGAIILMLGLGLVLLPEKQKHRETSPRQICQELSQQERYITVDEVADRLVQKDPTLLLADLRTPEEFERFSLPGAINIPVDKVLDAESDPFLNRKEFDVVFYCNDGTQSELAWQLRKRMLKTNTRILKGGLDQWIYDIFLAPMPDEAAAEGSFERYRFRQAVRTYLSGGSRPFTDSDVAPAPEPAPKPKQTIPLKPKAAQPKAEEGC